MKKLMLLAICMAGMMTASAQKQAETSVKPSGTLPVLYINVYTDENHSSLDNEIISKDLDHKNYFTHADYHLDLNNCQWAADQGAANIGSADAPLPLQIKARGNWTRRGFAKKPFKLKLDAKQKLMGLSKSKHFALLAHADDNCAYLRNFTGFNIGRRIGLPWTPWQQPVEVVINGDYRGLYFITESIRIDKDRINITELDDLADDPALCSGGYLVELDNYDEDPANQISFEEKSWVDGHYLDRLRVTFDTPEEYSPLQRQFITDQFEAMNNAVGANDNNLWSYLDLDDAARYYIAREIISDTESFHGSTYLFRDRGEAQKWHFSPIWDCGNAFNGPTDGYFFDHDPYGNTWIPSMSRNDRFSQKVKETWIWFMQNRYPGLTDDITQYTDRIAQAAKTDHRRWENQPVPDGGSPVQDNSDITGRRSHVLWHLDAKVNWLKTKWGDYTTTETVNEPARDNTPAAPLPSYLTVGIENIISDPTQTGGTDTNTPAEYFDITGRRISGPTPGQPAIERRGPTAHLIINR